MELRGCMDRASGQAPPGWLRPQWTGRPSW